MTHWIYVRRRAIETFRPYLQFDACAAYWVLEVARPHSILAWLTLLFSLLGFDQILLQSRPHCGLPFQLRLLFGDFLLTSNKLFSLNANEIDLESVEALS